MLSHTSKRAWVKEGVKFIQLNIYAILTFLLCLKKPPRVIHSPRRQAWNHVFHMTRRIFVLYWHLHRDKIVMVYLVSKLKIFLAKSRPILSGL